ncbi:CCR4-NOT transcription complex subunit 11-like [Octopus sinensis]|uniref:CCR4-NOT transcription complex subunit 11 n=1 Tax=Octopus sinensis TaxID=2607531 RepID=A0A6P7TP46_9MOLL|nr:CCR4-NOT transcription complex subunit 11-like [Octopus sinensis]
MLVDMIISLENEPRFLCQIAVVDKDLFAQLLGASSQAAKVLIAAVSGTELFITLLSTVADISTFRSLELVKDLINAPGKLISVEFVHKYVINFMHKTSSATCGEDSGDARVRWVRILFAFLTSIIKQRMFDLRVGCWCVKLQPIVSEIQSFCCDHSKMKESTALYKLIRSLDEYVPQ